VRLLTGLVKDRLLGHMYFREKVECGNMGIGDLEEEDVLGRQVLEGPQ